MRGDDGEGWPRRANIGVYRFHIELQLFAYSY